MRIRTVAPLFLAIAAAGLAAPAAEAALFRAYVSRTGSDTNDCTLSMPCRLLPAALAAVADGGEIWMLDSANYNVGMVHITKSVSILAVPGALGSLVSTGGEAAIRIDTSGVKVSLRNLVVSRRADSSSSNAVWFTQGARLHISDSEFAGLEGTAIHLVAPSAMTTMDRVTIRGTNEGIRVGMGTLVLSRSTLVAPGFAGVAAQAGSDVSITDSVFSESQYCVSAASVAPEMTRVTVSRSTFDNCGTGIYAMGSSSGAIVKVTAYQNAISNSVYGLQAYQMPGSTVQVVLDGNAITHNTYGFHFVGTPTATVYSRGNNTFSDNAEDLHGGVLTPLVAK